MDCPNCGANEWIEDDFGGPACCGVCSNLQPMHEIEDTQVPMGDGGEAIASQLKQNPLYKARADFLSHLRDHRSASQSLIGSLAPGGSQTQGTAGDAAGLASLLGPDATAEIDALFAEHLQNAAAGGEKTKLTYELLTDVLQEMAPDICNQMIESLYHVESPTTLESFMDNMNPEAQQIPEPLRSISVTLKNVVTTWCQAYCEQATHSCDFVDKNVRKLQKKKELKARLEEAATRKRSSTHAKGTDEWEKGLSRRQYTKLRKEICAAYKDELLKRTAEGHASGDEAGHDPSSAAGTKRKRSVLDIVANKMNAQEKLEEKRHVANQKKEDAHVLDVDFLLPISFVIVTFMYMRVPLVPAQVWHLLLQGRVQLDLFSALRRISDRSHVYYDQRKYVHGIFTLRRSFNLDDIRESVQKLIRPECLWSPVYKSISMNMPKNPVKRHASTVLVRLLPVANPEDAMLRYLQILLWGRGDQIGSYPDAETLHQRNEQDCTMQERALLSKYFQAAIRFRDARLKASSLILRGSWHKDGFQYRMKMLERQVTTAYGPDVRRKHGDKASTTTDLIKAWDRNGAHALASCIEAECSEYDLMADVLCTIQTQASRQQILQILCNLETYRKHMSLRYGSSFRVRDFRFKMPILSSDVMANYADFWRHLQRGQLTDNTHPNKDIALETVEFVDECMKNIRGAFSGNPTSPDEIVASSSRDPPPPRPIAHPVGTSAGYQSPSFECNVVILDDEAVSKETLCMTILCKACDYIIHPRFYVSEPSVMDNEARNYVHRLVNIHQVTVCEFIDFFAEKGEDREKKKDRKSKHKEKSKQFTEEKAMEKSTLDSGT